MSENCPMCGAGPSAERRFIGWRRDDLGGEFYITTHPSPPFTKRCWHPFHKPVLPTQNQRPGGTQIATLRGTQP